MHEPVLEAGDVIFVRVIEFSGQILLRTERHVVDGRTSRELCKQKPYRGTVIPFGELVVFMSSGKSAGEGDVCNVTNVMLGLVDRSDETIVAQRACDLCFRLVAAESVNLVRSLGQSLVDEALMRQDAEMMLRPDV